MENLLQIILVSVLTAWLTYFFGIRQLKTDARLKWKAERYSKLIDTFSTFLEGQPNEQAFTSLNDTFFFASDEVLREVMKFNDLFTEKRKKATERIKIESKDIVPLIQAIRNEFRETSKSIDERINEKKEIPFFFKPRKFV